MPIEKQVEQVRKVKRSESGLIIDPITLHAEATIGDALRLMNENKIGGIPIVDNNKKLVGILTNRDLRFEKRLDRLVDYFLAHGASDRTFAHREAVVAIGRAVRHQAFMLGFSDAIIIQSAVLGLGLAAVLFLRGATQSPPPGGLH